MSVSDIDDPPRSPINLPGLCCELASNVAVRSLQAPTRDSASLRPSATCVGLCNLPGSQASRPLLPTLSAGSALPVPMV
eukprot:2225311-Rhodomonas_salina.1